jgi:hypothetical protein
MRAVDPKVLSRFVRETAELASDFVNVFRNLIKDVRDSYRRELCYVRGPGVKWRGKHPPR